MAGISVDKNPEYPAQTIICFYGRRPVYGNFFIMPFQCGGRRFNCSEQYFQYKKAMFFQDQKTANKIMKTSSPGQQKKLGRRVRGYNESKWSEVRSEVMLHGLIQKFSQNPEAKKSLLATGDARLAECKDKIWGNGLALNNPNAANPRKWRGTNLLGQVLEKVRENLSKEE